jgi:hypothetical protein
MEISYQRRPPQSRVAQAFARLLRRRAFSAKDALPVDFGHTSIELTVGWQPAHRHTASGVALEPGDEP